MDKSTFWFFGAVLIIGLVWISFAYKDFELGMEWISSISLMFIAIALLYIANKIDKKK